MDGIDTTQNPLLHDIIERLRIRQESVHRWLQSYEKTNELPLYSSVDIRDAGFKAAVVDTNLFPAGFNNLCEHGLKDSETFIRDAILRRVPNGKRVLIIAEEHTRNTWYLENLRILNQIISQAGFDCRIATFLTVQPAFCEKTRSVEFITATGHPLRIHCFKNILEEFRSGNESIDLIIMNNDLTTGIPDVLKNSSVPIYPSIQAGWHARHKSHHFCHTRDLMKEFAQIIGVDPWLFSCEFTVLDHIDINNENDRRKLADAAAVIFKRIEKKYAEHGIHEKPYLVLKSDSGTYGMGVKTFEQPEEILQLNRRSRNSLAKGKSSKVIDRYLLQEGVPTVYHIDHKVSEVVIYQIENNLIGGFYRSHPAKTARENLNSSGMDFQKMCPHLSKYGDCGVHHDLNIFDVYRILARIAAIAAHREIVQLEAQST